MTNPVVIVRASVVRVHDADTYLMVLDMHLRGLGEDGCEQSWIRLAGYSGRELGDTAPTDPKGLDRLPGPEAKAAAEAALASASQTLVELRGPVSFGRYIADVYVDDVLLGEVLADNHAVAHGAFEGADDPFVANALQTRRQV